MSRNLKATGVVTGLYAIALALGLFGAMVKPETRITGTIAGEPVDIPAWLQNDPKYDKKIKNVKVEQGWGGLRLLLWGAALVPAGLGLALSGERQAELEKERREYDRALKEEGLLAEVNTAYKVGLRAILLKKRGEAQVALEEDRLEEEVDSIREANGWFAPPIEQSHQRAIEPPVLREKEAIQNPFEGMKTPEEYAKEIEEARQGAIARLRTGENGTDEGGQSDRPADSIADAEYQLYQERGEQVMRSLAALKISILSAAPTGAGKSTTMDRWLKDLMALYPEAELYVIAQKNDSFMGLAEQGRVCRFKAANPEGSLYFLQKVYAEMERRLDATESDRPKYKELPVRLILDDWHATFSVLKLDNTLWQSTRTMLVRIITLGREANVNLYIATQSYNLVTLGLVEDSGIRSNLAITCQGLVKAGEEDDTQQGDYSNLQNLIKNQFIVPAKEDRERLMVELEKVVDLSIKYQVPAVFSAIGKPSLALVPFYKKRVSKMGDRVQSTKNNDEQVSDQNQTQAGLDLWEEFQKEMLKRQQQKADFDNRLPQSDYPQNPNTNGWNGANTCNTAGNAGNEYQSNDNSNTEEEELKNWYKWLPKKEEVIELIESLEPIYNLAYVVKNRLKKTEGFYNRRAKAAIVRLLLDTGRDDLIKKLDIDDPNLYPFPD